MSGSHPYKQYENTALWRAIDEALADLVDNGDLSEKTSRNHIVGYLTQQVASGSIAGIKRKTRVAAASRPIPFPRPMKSRRPVRQSPAK